MVKSVPVIDNATIIQFAKLHIKLLPRGNELTVVIPTDVFFKLNHPALQAEQNTALDTLAGLLKRYGPVKIKVAGFTDNVASPAFNQRLSEQQARAMATYLWTRGIQAEQLYAVGYGDRGPVADNATATDSAANRRIEITLKAQCTYCG